METVAPHQDASLTPTVEQIDRWVEDTVHAARTETDADRFYEFAASQLLRITSGVAAAVWLLDEDGMLRPVALRANPRLESVVAGLETERQRAVRQASGGLREQVALLTSDGANGTPARDGVTAIAVPVLREGDAIGVVESLLDADIGDSTRDGCRQVTAEFADIVLEFLTAAELRALRGQAELWSRFEQFSVRVHASLDRRETTFAIANDGRGLIECDRVSVLIAAGAGCRALAVSGTDAINRRSTSIRRLEPLSAAVMRTGETLWYDEESPPQPPQIDRPLQGYLEASPSRALAIVPLLPPAKEAIDRFAPPFAAIVIENFEANWPFETSRRVAAVAAQARSALANAMRHRAANRLPLIGRFLGGGLRESSPGRKWAIAGAVLLALVAALWLIPGDFEVSARGQLLPVDRRNVYAPNDGIVRIESRPGAGDGRVAESAVVASLRSPELDRESTRILGELQTVRKQLDAIKNARSRNERDGGREKSNPSDLAARERELEQKRDNLQRDLTLLQGRAADLMVRSPLSGRILTWDVVRRLDGRPVRRGDVLMRVARLDGPWELVLMLPEREAGYVRDARRNSDDAIRVRFQSANDPGRVHTGRVKSIARMADVSKEGVATIRVTVAIENTKGLTLRPGATVTARFHCGRKPIGYVWFHDIIDTTRGWLSW